MSEPNNTDKNITSVPIYTPLVFGAGGAALFFGWMTFAAWQKAAFEWSNLLVPGGLCLAALCLFFWAVLPRR